MQWAICATGGNCYCRGRVRYALAGDIEHDQIGHRLQYKENTAAVSDRSWYGLTGSLSRETGRLAKNNQEIICIWNILVDISHAARERMENIVQALCGATAVPPGTNTQPIFFHSFLMIFVLFSADIAVERGLRDVHGQRHPIYVTSYRDVAALQQVQCIADGRHGARTRRFQHWLVQSICSASILRSAGR